LIADGSGQKFLLTGSLIDAHSGASVEIAGTWSTVGEGAAAQEVIDVQHTQPAKIAAYIVEPRYLAAKYVRTSFGPFASIAESLEPEALTGKRAPIRTTSPGLTVFQGGAVTPRVYFVKQHLGDLDVWRQVFDLAVSYTPTPHLQLELEVPFSRTSFDDGASADSGAGLGNIMLWGKYRFFRKVKTYGDRQASARFGLELPTGKKTAPGATSVNASAFVRQQLTPINGGFSPHFDISFSQAGGRFIFGGNAEGIFRTERDGFRMGHELRVNTDLEYVLLPRDYQKPGKELFLILESTFVTQARGRLNGISVPGSSSNVYYLSPGLQYAAHPRFVVEGSIQLPVYRSAGPQVLRTDMNLLLGVKYLF
jgi:hypothetical protein